ncbi:hypothetical protein ILYODFUR_037569, partial [Ilyodon furcidens]
MPFQVLVLVVFRFIRDRVVGAADSVETPRRPSPQTPPPAPLGGAQGVPRPAKKQSIQRVLGLLLEHLQRKDVEEQRLYSESLPDGRAPHPISKRECPATLRRKLIS